MSEEPGLRRAGGSVASRHDPTQPVQGVRRAVIMYVRFPLSLRKAEDLLHGPAIQHGNIRGPSYLL